MDFALPEIGEGVYEAELVRWQVRPGDVVRRGQPLLEVMTDKATMEIPAPNAFRVEQLKAEPGDKVKVGQPLLSYASDQADNAAVPAPAEKVASVVRSVPVSVPAPARQGNGTAGEIPVKAAPSVRHLARKLGIDLRSVQGSGPEGRILLDDLTSFVRPPGGRDAPPLPAPRFDYGRPGTRIKMQGLRRLVAEQMVRSAQKIPHYSYIDECDATDLVRLRGSLKDTYSRAVIKLTYLPFFVKAVVAALKEVPIVNSSLDEEGGEIVLHERYHIGIAVSTPAGLMVPVVKDADKKDIGTIAREIDRLSAEARAVKSKREDLRGGTFTITSVGNLGGLISTPVINHPEVGILGIGKVVRRPVYDESGQVRPADLVYLSFSFDHRVVDGAVGAVFGNAVLRQLHNPAALLLPEKL